MPRDLLVEHLAIPLDDRISLPKPFCQRVEWMVGEKVEAWLYVIEPGRYRLLSDQEVETDPQLEAIKAIRAQVLHESKPTRGRPSEAKPLRDAADITRLVPVTIDHHRGSWRISFGAEFAPLAPTSCNPRNISVLMPEGYLEIWYTDLLRKALDPPWKTDRQ